MSKHRNSNIDWRNPTAREDTEPRRRDRDGDVPRKRESTPDPTAKILLEIVSEQVRNFLALDPDDRFDGQDALYNFGGYSADLHNFEGAEDLVSFQLDRTVRINRDNPEDLRRLSTDVVILSKTTNEPAFYITSFITPRLEWNVSVVPFNERGPNYRAKASFDSRSRLST